MSRIRSGMLTVDLDPWFGPNRPVHGLCEVAAPVCREGLARFEAAMQAAREEMGAEAPPEMMLKVQRLGAIHGVVAQIPLRFVPMFLAAARPASR